jgi:hypothetical protein
MVARSAIHLLATEGSGEPIISTLEARLAKSLLSARNDLMIAQLTIQLHELCQKPQEHIVTGT